MVLHDSPKDAWMERKSSESGTKHPRRVVQWEEEVKLILNLNPNICIVLVWFVQNQCSL